MNPGRSPVPARVLVVDDDRRYGEWLRHHLDVLCPQASVSMLNLEEFQRWCTTFSGRDCDLLMLAVIALADDGNELTAVRALQLGAVDYLPKRLLTPERLSTAVRVALHRVERRVARRLASLANLSRDAAFQGGNDAEQTAPPPAAKAAEQTGPPAAAADNDGAGGGLPASGIAALLTTNSEFIPGYTLRLKIGESEKAVVYLASSTHRGHNVALKVSKTLRDEAAGRQFLEREYTAIIAVRSPLVVEIYDYGVHGGFEYLAMEYLPRGDLKARIQRGVSEQEALHYVAQIAAALQVVHEAGLVHRDLKPPNVMLRDNDSVALIDFGLARSVDGSTISTQTGVLLGSPYYMSPEQAQGDGLDARSDFYSLGVICYELLTGQKPYIGGTAMEVLQQHVNAPLPALPEDLSRYEPFLKRLMAKSRGERFATAAEIIAATQALRTNAPPDLSATGGEARTSAA